jgi:integrase
VAQYLAQWLDGRTTRTAEDERRWLETYVLPIEWLATMPMLDLEDAPGIAGRVIAALKSLVSPTTGRKLTPKSVANAFGVLQSAVRGAVDAGVLRHNPMVAPRGSLKRGPTKRRQAYDVRALLALTTDERLPPDALAWNALAFFTGMREGEVCGRRWRDYDRDTRPLGCLVCDTQYDGQPLKTDEEGEARPRRVPVHPRLAAILARWRERWELVHRRKPTGDDFIVPRRVGGAHTKSSAYKAWRRSCDVVGVANLSLHSTRTTFITQARRGGARKDVLEKVTHNAAGDILDAYTRWDWAPLCEAVLCLRIEPEIEDEVAADVAAPPKMAWFAVEAPGIEPGGHDGIQRNPAQSSAVEAAEEPPSFPGYRRRAADVAAWQRPRPGYRPPSPAECRAALLLFEGVAVLPVPGRLERAVALMGVA